MELRVRETGQVITEREFRSLHPTTSFPRVLTLDILDSYGVDPVLEGPQATTTPPYETSVRQGVEEVNGQWFTKYVVGPVFTDTEEATAAEQEAAYRTRIDERAATSVRAQRDRLLAETDWVITKAKETETNIPDAMKTYRQALRDITTQEGFPHNITWPEKP